MKITYNGLLWTMIGGAMAFVTFVMLAAHWNDAELQAECEARGGTFVHSTQPLHLCVKTVDQPIVQPRQDVVQ